MSIRQKLYQIIASQLGADPNSLNPEAMIQSDLNADPIALVDLISVLEDRFQIDIPAEEAKELETVQDIETLISEKINEL